MSTPALAILEALSTDHLLRVYPFDGGSMASIVTTKTCKSEDIDSQVADGLINRGEVEFLRASRNGFHYYNISQKGVEVLQKRATRKTRKRSK